MNKTIEPPVLLTAAQAAKALGVSERTFHKLRKQPWMPAEIVLTSKVVRWSREELVAAHRAMPRRSAAMPEPSTLAAGRRARIERLKSGASAWGATMSNQHASGAALAPDRKNKEPGAGGAPALERYICTDEDTARATLDRVDGGMP